VGSGNAVVRRIDGSILQRERREVRMPVVPVLVLPALQPGDNRVGHRREDDLDGDPERPVERDDLRPLEGSIPGLYRKSGLPHNDPTAQTTLRLSRYVMTPARPRFHGARAAHSRTAAAARRTGDSGRDKALRRTISYMV